ncbi:MAG TPA: beta-ketoacyl synthase chain length factor [Gallionella sp.]|nr:beta-ketoacyl synthase chain length factor [Gallionella sp.]
MRVFVEGIGLLGPGLNGWQTSQGLLAGSTPYQEVALAIPPTELLPPAERRRAPLSVRLALAVGQEAVAQCGRNVVELASVFASATGDGDNIHHICETLAANGRELSPTRFHNSVHNAPSGYWSIATKAMMPSTALCAHDASFAAGLLEAAAQVVVDGNAAVLICYDTPYPQPLHAVRPISAAFGVALVLNGKQTAQSLAELEIGIIEGHLSATSLDVRELEALCSDVPAARCLPLLAALAGTGTASVLLDYFAGSQITVEVRSC